MIYHLDAPAEPVPKRATPGRWNWERHLDGVSPQVRRPMTAYLERLHGTLARSTVQGAACELAHFGRFLARYDPGLASLALLDRRRHIEPYLTEVAVAVNHRTGQPIAASTAKQRIQTVGSFLDAIAEWGWAEAPARRLVFPRDAPKLPHPLPRYLRPDHERALLRALEASPNRLRADALLLLRATGSFLAVARPMTSSPKERNVEARSPDESIPAAANRAATRSCSSAAAALLNASSRMRPGATNPRLTA